MNLRLDAAICISLAVMHVSQLLVAGIGSGVDDGRWLQQVYHATGGEQWSSVCYIGWNLTLGAFPCDGNSSRWKWVTCNGNGRVTEVDLSVCNLNGTLPELDGSTGGAMSELQIMLLFTNKLSGPLPASWSSMSSLQKLDFSSNKLSSSLPDSWSSLTRLQSIRLQANLFSGTLPESWCSLSSLQLMILYSNQLNGPLPGSWSNLSSLQWMYLYNNQLNGPLPASWSNLSSLQRMLLSSNQLNETLPDSWSSLSGLQWMSLFGNNLTGPLPASWSSMSSLQTMDLANNTFNHTLPDSWSNLSSLQSVYLLHNQISGSLPASWSRMSSLQAVYLHENLLDGTLPGSWSRLSSLQSIYLQNNSLEGPLPASWSSLSSLQQMILYENVLNGTLPGSWSNLSSLQWMYLYSNQLNGPLPASWSNLSSLQRMIISRNRFDGRIPASWSSLSSLQQIYLHRNQLTGTLPPTWSRLSRLQEVILHNNQFRGPLPASWSSLTSVKQMYLYRNRLTGVIPSSWETGLINLPSSELQLESNCLNVSSIVADNSTSRWNNKSTAQLFLLPQFSNCSATDTSTESRLVDTSSTTHIPVTTTATWPSASAKSSSSASISVASSCSVTASGDSSPSASMTSFSESHSGGGIATTWSTSRGSNSISIASTYSVSRVTLRCSLSRTMTRNKLAASSSTATPSREFFILSSTGSHSNPSKTQLIFSVSLVAPSASKTELLSSSPFSRSMSIALVAIGAPSNRPTAQLVTNVASTAGLLPIAVGGGGGALQRSLLQLRLASCSPADGVSAWEALDIPSSPTRLTIDVSSSGRNLRYVRGAVVGNTLLFIAAAGVAYTVSRVGASTCGSGRGWRLLSLFALPGSAVQPGMLLLQPTLSSAVSCLLALAWNASWSIADAVIGAWGVVLVSASGLWMVWVLLIGDFRAQAVLVRRRHELPLLHRVFCPLYNWRDAAAGEAAGGFVLRFRPLFEPYRPSMRGFLIVEFVASAASGVIGGFLPYAPCSRALLWCTSALNVAVLLCVVVLRPYNVIWDLIMSVVCNGLGVVWAVLVLTDVGGPLPDSVSAAQAYLLLVMTITSQLQRVASVARMLWTWPFGVVALEELRSPILSSGQSIVRRLPSGSPLKGCSTPREPPELPDTKVADRTMQMAALVWLICVNRFERECGVDRVEKRRQRSLVGS